MGRADGRRGPDGRGRGLRRPRAHAITGWLGADAYELEPHTAAFKPDRPGVVVVCTDGLWNYAESADEMAEAVPADAAARPCTPPVCWSVTPSTAAGTTT